MKINELFESPEATKPPFKLPRSIRSLNDDDFYLVDVFGREVLTYAGSRKPTPADLAYYQKQYPDRKLAISKGMSLK
jgi:hypothetical protein